MSRSPLAAPPRRALLAECRVAWEWVAGRRVVRRIAVEGAKAAGQAVVVVPGIGTGDRWTARLRRTLNAVGFRAVGWGLGRNRGVVLEVLGALREQVQRAAGDDGPARLVGWSLGGIICRELARESPELVERVVTLGTPVVGGPAYTATAPLYRWWGYDIDRFQPRIEERERTPIRVPVAAVYSRRDGVVAWRACIDRYRNPHVRHHEVHSRHFGLIVAPEPLQLVVDLLSRPLAE